MPTDSVLLGRVAGRRVAGLRVAGCRIADRLVHLCSASGLRLAGEISDTVFRA